MKIRLGSRIHRYAKRVSIFLITVALVVGMAGCESTCTPLQHALNILSTLGGTVTILGEGNSPYPSGEVVTLVATPDAGYRFVQWTGDVDDIDDVTSPTIIITMNGDYSITANFEQVPPGQFTLTISSTAGGSVTAPGEGTRTYGAGTVVSLVATPASGYRFVNWTGNVGTIANVNAASTNITMNGHYSITAEFIWQYDLSISSTEGGEVTEPGEGVFPCDEGSVVDLVAEAEAGYQFVNWTGDVGTIADVYAATTTVTMNDDYTITANFALPIWDWYDLDAIRDNLGGSYILMNDLDSTTAGYTELASETANNEGTGWQPIGTTAENDKFAGSFDGQGHEICNLFIDRPAESNVGLFGVVGGGGVIENVVLMNVTVTGGWRVGGLAGHNSGNVSNSYSTGSVTGGWQVGGLVGYNDYGTVSNSYSIGSMTGWGYVGGLVGVNDYGTVSNSYSTGRVTGWWYVGGLVGVNGYGTVSNSYSTGRVTGWWYVGGLVGWNGNAGNISNSHSTGSVSGNTRVGGLVGFNDGNVSNSYSSGSVTGSWRVGGLAGHNSGNVSNSYSTASVTGSGWDVGGLVGNNEGTVSNSYSTGSATGNNNVGGLVGQNSAAVSDSYATGSATGGKNVGGLTGRNEGTVSNSYSTGSVTGTSNVGGLVGRNFDTVSDSFWDTQTSGQATSSGGTGKTTAEMQDIATFTDPATEGLDDPWDITAVAPGKTDDAYTWNIVDDETYPFLSWEPV